MKQIIIGGAACLAFVIMMAGLEQVAERRWNSKPVPINTSLTFTATNRLVVTHYIIIPATHADWSALTGRYPANVTRTTLKFE